MNPGSFDTGDAFQRASSGDGILFWFISTPAVQKGGIAIAQMVAPFSTEEEAQRGADLLNDRFPGNRCWVGRGEHAPISPGFCPALPGGAAMTELDIKKSLRSRRGLVPDTPSRLCGTFSSGLHVPGPQQILDDFLGRVEREPDPCKRLMQAQRAIGALMGLTAAQVRGAGFVFFHKDVFRRLSELTGETENALVQMAGVER
ncbi:hypothetical protein ACFZOQ_28040 [Pseudomonas aeruginosa]